MAEWTGTCRCGSDRCGLRPEVRVTITSNILGRMTAPTRHLDNEKYHIQDELDISRTAMPSCSSSRCDELVTTNYHDPVMPQREGSKPWLSVLIIVVAISLSFIFVFQDPRAFSSCFRFLIPSFSNATAVTARVPSDTTFFTPTSPAFSSNGRTDQVQWDNYTLVLRGQRVLI